VALDNEEKVIMLCETKWQYLDREEAEDTLEKLQERASSVKWFKERREHFCLIGKKISGKEGLREKRIPGLRPRGFREEYSLTLSQSTHFKGKSFSPAVFA